MNDPFDCLPTVIRSYSANELEEYRTEISKSNNPDLRKLAFLSDTKLNELFNEKRKRSIERYAYCSLSESYDNILLWSHYGCAHTGFVLGLEFEDLKDHTLQKVKYVNKLPNYHIKNHALYDTGDDYYLQFIFQDFSVKADIWEYEKEWRIWRNGSGYFGYKLSELKEIYFGVNTADETRLLVFKILDSNIDDFKVYDLEFNDNPISLRR